MFSSGALARSALAALHGLPFDDGATLRAEVARKNMYLADPNAPGGGGAGGIPGGAPPGQKRLRTGGADFGGGPGGPGGPRGGGPGGGPGGARGGGGGGGAGDNPPCTTLFVGNLSQNVDQNELRAVFESQPVRAARHITLACLLCLYESRTSPRPSLSPQSCSFSFCSP